MWWLLVLQRAGSRAQAQWLWRTGFVAPWHVGSSRTRARTRVPCIDRWILNHCTTREVPCVAYFRSMFLWKWFCPVYGNQLFLINKHNLFDRCSWCLHSHSQWSGRSALCRLPPLGESTGELSLMCYQEFPGASLTIHPCSSLVFSVFSVQSRWVCSPQLSRTSILLTPFSSTFFRTLF